MSVPSPRDDSPPDGGEELERFRRWRDAADRAARDELVLGYRPLAISCARRFANRGEPLDDLIQVAMLGLCKAVERFDPERGIPFAGYAVPTVTGELRRHFRDATWAVHVPRRAKDLHVRLPRVIERMTAESGHPPTPTQLAADLGVSVEEVIDGLDAGAAYRSTSMETPEGARGFERAEVRSDAVFSHGLDPTDGVQLESLLMSLPERERTIMWLRFFEDLSQSEIAERVGMSQVHVSRLLRQSLRLMRDRAGEQ